MRCDRRQRDQKRKEGNAGNGTFSPETGVAGKMREQRADRGGSAKERQKRKVVVNFKSEVWLRELTKMKTKGETKEEADEKQK